MDLGSPLHVLFLDISESTHITLRFLHENTSFQRLMWYAWQYSFLDKHSLLHWPLLIFFCIFQKQLPRAIFLSGINCVNTSSSCQKWTVKVRKSLSFTINPHLLILYQLRLHTHKCTQAFIIVARPVLGNKDPLPWQPIVKLRPKSHEQNSIWTKALVGYAVDWLLD